MALTQTGYDAPEITELVENMSQNARDLFGALIDTSADSALGHFIGVNSLEIVKIYEDLTEFYSNLNANTAEGRMLENVSLLGGIVRKDKAKSTCIVDFTGPLATLIPEGTVIHVAGDNTKRFLTRNDVIIAADGIVRVQVVAETTGAIEALAGTLTEFDQDIPGVTVTNNLDATLGTEEIESEAQLRARRNNTLTIGGNGTPAAMRAALEQLRGVVTVRAISNPTHYFVDRGDGIYQRPPHSVECVIEGGDEIEIIETIALTKSGTSDAFGLLMAFYQDVIGNNHQIRFSRPDIKDIEVTVDYRIYNEEIFPPDGEGRIVEEILKFAQIEYSLGKDVIRDRLYEPVLQVSGIGAIEIRIAKLGDPLSELNISIEDFEKARILANNVTVTRSN